MTDITNIVESTTERVERTVSKYVPQDIEPKWQAKWDADHLYRSQIDKSKPKHYALTMLPYPSGDLHIGHWYAMTPSDARARWMRMRGYNVLFPMGFDAFGLPAENAAISRKIHPKTWTYANIERMRKQMKTMGSMFDWEREMISCDPDYYRWSQWFFLKFYENGLAYRTMASVDFCPHCNTTLAREQVWGEDRHCERCGTPVIKKDLEQWFFRTTKYAEELRDHSHMNWPEKVNTMQENWVGKSEGAQVDFTTEQGDTLTVFTTRPDTLWGVTFMVLAPEHPLVEKVTTPDRHAAVHEYVSETSRRTEIERTAENKDKTGVFTGGYATNPVNGEKVPIWIADYVLANYGFGAIMAVPCGDQRDFEFARKFNLPVKVVVQPEGVELDGATMTEAFPDDGVIVNSADWFNGTQTKDGNAVQVVNNWLDQQGFGKRAVNYRLRDWLISRQRYWGTPIPIVYCDHCGTVPVPEDQLPVTLPEDVDFMPTGESPLKFHAGFLNTTCPTCGGPARRDTDTMDTFMCSSWYQLRYLSPHYSQAPFDPEEGAYWLPVDQYTGGIEHATMHLMYTRFFTKAMRDCGIYADSIDHRTKMYSTADAPSLAAIDDEPMLSLYNQGMILGEPQIGAIVRVVGTVETGKINAKTITVIAPEEVETATEAEGEVVGEIVKRAENLLNIERKDGSQITVEVFDNVTVITDHAGNVLDIGALRYRLGVEKMSKSKGNVVAPDVWVSRYGADVVRGYLMFAFRWEQGGPWDSQGIQGVVRWLNDVWTIYTDTKPVAGEPSEQEVRALRRKVHQTIQRVSDGLETFGFNTAVAGLMELKNTMQSARRTAVINHPVWQEARESMLLLMAPFTPHIAEELWSQLGNTASVHTQAFPIFDPEAAKADEITLIVQVNGKVRAKLTAPAGISDAEAKALATDNAEVTKFFNGGTPKQVIYVAGRGLINIVV